MGWVLLGLVLGLAVGAGAVAAILRAVGRITGTDLRGVGRLILDGLRPGASEDGVAAQRSLARRLKHASERTASGRRVAADELAVHVSPEDHAAIDAAIGIEAAEADLAVFYAARAARGDWLVGADPQVRIVRDISLRPRQSFVHATTRAPARAASVPPETRPPVSLRLDDVTTDVLPRGLPDAFPTAVYPAGMLLGDLVAVHGTDVRTILATAGTLRVGRARHNDLIIDRPGVGRDHLVVEVRGDSWWIVPGTSDSPTMLDGHALSGPAQLLDTATLEFGRGVRLRLSVDRVSRSAAG